MKKETTGFLIVAVLLFAFTYRKKNKIIVHPLEGNFLGYAKAGAILYSPTGEVVKVYKGGEALTVYTSEFKNGIEYLIVSDATNANGKIKAVEVNQIQIRQNSLGRLPFTL